MEEGTRIRYTGEGDVGRGGAQSGDLYVVLSIRKHDFFEREGQNLHCVIPISFPQAALGADIEIAGVDGPVMLKIPEGTQSGKGIASSRQGSSLPEREGPRRPDRQGCCADTEKADPRATRTDYGTQQFTFGGE